MEDLVESDVTPLIEHLLVKVIPVCPDGMSRSQAITSVCNGPVNCNTVHGIAMNNDGKIYFTDGESRKLAEILNNEVTVIAGCESDGSNSSSCALFSQPTTLCVKENTLYVADTLVIAIQTVTPCEEMCKSLKEFNALYQVFGVHLKKKKAEWYLLEEPIPPLERLYDFCTSWIEDVQQCMRKECVTQGPEGTVSRKSVHSLELMILSLKRIQESSTNCLWISLLHC
ncbi:Hypothetical predicted protein [Paramuricea clavata]|uniref:Uncharacterized protein n=1 Tax=Paramuricea clavata TaxID=317549 RepID=A0A7D9D638_PARCT|nr:Hypothetical predicted protein [Paramuricea clavata]